jgi:hypothetical protein
MASITGNAGTTGSNRYQSLRRREGEVTTTFADPDDWLGPHWSGYNEWRGTSEDKPVSRKALPTGFPVPAELCSPSVLSTVTDNTQLCLMHELLRLKAEEADNDHRR